MKKLSREVKIGIFGVAMIILLYLGINFIKSKNIFSRDSTFYAVYEQADGLEVSSPVIVKGFRIGTVEKISFDIATTNVIVKMSVKHQYPIPADSRAKITSTSIMGGKVIEIMLGNNPTDMRSKDTIRTIYEPGILQMAGDEYGKLKDMASTLVEQLSRALTNINMVLSDENVGNISATLANLNSISTNIDGLVASERPNIAAAIRDFGLIASALKDATPKLGNTFDKFSILADSLEVQVPEVVRNFNNSISRLNTTLAKIEEGDGTLGKLVADDELYCNLTYAAEDLSLLLQDIKAAPERYIHISVFGKKSKQTSPNIDQQPQSRKQRKEKE